MRQFVDAEGAAWKLDLTIGDIPRIAADTGVHLLQLDRAIEEDKDRWTDATGRPMIGLQRLMFDLPLTYRVMYSMVSAQAKEVCPEPTEWGRRISRVHQAAYDAFFEELRDFFQQIRQTWLATFVGKQLKLVATIQATADAMYEQVSVATVEEAVRKQLASILGASSGGQPGESESTPDH